MRGRLVVRFRQLRDFRELLRESSTPLLNCATEGHGCGRMKPSQVRKTGREQKSKGFGNPNNAVQHTASPSTNANANAMALAPHDDMR